MEIWGPIALLASVCSARVLSTTGPVTLSTVFPSLSLENFTALPIANQILAGFYLLHYLNRALVGPCVRRRGARWL